MLANVFERITPFRLCFSKVGIVLRSLVLSGVLFGFTSEFVSAQTGKTREQKVREDQQKVTSEGFWIYNDLAQGFEKAKESGKPILVVLRCLPCEECVKLDDDLVDTDPVLRPLLEKFVCVRVVATNGLDLSVFQYDTDQSFAVFMLNADKTIYGRFGTRSHRTEWVGDVSLRGLAEAMKGALALHQDFPACKNQLAAKTGPKPMFETPEKSSLLKDRYTSQLNFVGDVVKSCIHCHQIGDAIRDEYRQRNEPIPEEVLSPYPHPKSLGMILDPEQRATVKEIVAGSLADAAGFKPGDQIQTMSGQPILSMADVQWVLHGFSPDGGDLPVKVLRMDREWDLTFRLKAGWRRLDDISWRVSSWGLRRMSTGGLFLESISQDEREKARLTNGSMALRVKHVGQFGAHAAAKNAGFQKDDIIVSFDGHTDLQTDSDVLRYGVTEKRPGDFVDVEIIRNDERKTLKLPMQK